MAEDRIHRLELSGREIEGRLSRLEEDMEEQCCRHNKLKDLVVEHDRYIVGQRAVWKALVALGIANIVGVAGILLKVLRE